ncbi:FitA-like ribbon-helix-helix domain-containing protein [Acidithiobacillus caldus]|uniref:Antitoxin FitA-like ribbon-helix-helix domain-containing protein n=1 Tax=Acidithiobacillus caldus TaxID=33059 RepID=A0A1E7YQ19_9PROT|nr:hypothetical protein [Acidithiobacillus caldus]OFC37631.1 hypothetical protein BAE29_10320 [Acidithiobacillus caldus]OFC37753.1 hypothetical protein BAE28_06760 [Acidithiobacillus caldus]OFC37873.1 hypothetical protein BAE27_03330 [Acidithiobacillus caldus]
MTSQILIRGIADQTITALKSLAKQHNRALEAEARQALSQWVDANTAADTTRAQIAARLRYCLEEINGAPNVTNWSVTRIAEAIGERSAPAVAGWFAGEEDAPFTGINAIANTLGVRADWLKHDDGHLFQIEEKRLSQDPYEAVDWLLRWDDEDSSQLKALYLIRAKTKCGELYIVKQSKLDHVKIYHTPLHISDQIGAGGTAMLGAFFLTLKLLYKRDISARVQVSSLMLDSDEIKLMMTGNKHPLKIIRNSRSLWWQDIWDPKMRDNLDAYWDGCLALHHSIWSYINSQKFLKESNEQITQGKLQKNEIESSV